jgi:hypothetical protein
MARLGNKTSDKETENGRKYFGDKDVQYLKDKSRESLEVDQNFSVLYFGIDWDLSNRNFYGELLTKKFKTSKGVPIKASFKIIEGSEQVFNDIPNKIMKLNVACYVEHLKELNIDPKQDDFFAIGQRLYRIYNLTLKDSGPGNILVNRERLQVYFDCVQDDDEVLQKNVWGDNLGLESQINSENGDISK